jgi:hypothetical protein
MSQILAIDWDDREARFVLASTSGEKLHVTAVAAIAFDDLSEAETVGEAGVEAASSPDPRLVRTLRAAIARHRAARATTLLGVDRGSIELMHLTLPPARDDELPELVTNQALRESTAFSDKASMDFLALDDDPAQPRQVIVAVLGEAQLERIRATCAASGIKPRRMLLRPYASASLFSRTASPQEDVCLLVNRVADEVDLTVLVRGKVVFSRTARLPAEVEKDTATGRLVDEIKRTLAVSPDNTGGAGPVEGIYIFGSPGDHQDLVQGIGEELAMPTMVIDPFVAVDVAGPLMPENSGSFASLLGMVLDEVRGGAHAIDFLHPRKPPAPPDRRRPLLVGAAMVVALILFGGYYVWDQLASVDTENQKLAVELADVKGLVKQAAQKKQAVAAIREWQVDEVNWLDELRDLSLRFPSSRDAIVLKMTMSPGRGGGATIQFSGLVRDPSIVVRMESGIRDSFHEIRSKGVQERQREKDYTWQFETSMSVARRDKSQYVSHLPQQPATEKNPAAAPESPKPPPGDSTKQTSTRSAPPKRVAARQWPFAGARASDP